MHSMLHLEEPGLKQRSASVVTVLTAAAMEGKVPIKIWGCHTECRDDGLIQKFKQIDDKPTLFYFKKLFIH